jgi:hypothetical protein
MCRQTLVKDVPFHENPLSDSQVPTDRHGEAERQHFFIFVAKAPMNYNCLKYVLPNIGAIKIIC